MQSVFRASIYQWRNLHPPKPKLDSTYRLAVTKAESLQGKVMMNKNKVTKTKLIMVQ